MRILILLLLSVLSACTGLPEGVESVDSVEPERYLGTWYEIARLDHSFERGMNNVTANYSLRDDGGVRVVNRGYVAGEWEDAEGKAYFTGDPSVGELKVSFFGPFYGGYNVIALDKDNYSYSMVAGPNREYLWILAREPEVDASVVDDLVALAASLNFPVDDLIFVEHGGIAE